MSTEFLLVGVGILITIAVFDIMVGVSNDAVNFLNSSIGSKVAPRATIMVIASLGIMAGATFSSGMMEVARKGIFHPEFFTMPELLTIFLAVMITDIILLDLFNTYGLPTSTTVSIVFELLGAAVAVSLLKILQARDSLATIVEYINSAKAITIIMGALGKKVQSDTFFLLIAGVIMVVTLWLSKKARTVTETELSLSQQEEGNERFESIFLSRAIVRLVLHVFETAKLVIPASLRALVSRRLNPDAVAPVIEEGKKPSFDLLRASVNLMVASAVVSYATSNKLPLSTTYVTFMVAMGSSFTDQAWGRESVVYRITGALTVIGGWFMTAVIAFTFAALFATVIFYGKAFGVVLLLALAAALIWNAHRKHRTMAEEAQKEQVFNLKSVEDPRGSVETTF